MSEDRSSPTFAFRIGYLADGFQGYARQPHATTVEGTVRAGLRRRGALAPEDEARFRTASRTDRGVHALGNVVSFPTRLSGHAAARVLNTLDPRIFCSGYAPVLPTFQPRHARERWYRYLEPKEGRRRADWERRAALMEGEHDLASFSRRDDPPRPTRGRVTSFRVSEEGPFLVLDLRAPSFQWNQVRKMVGALELLEEGRLDEADLRQALAGRKALSLPLAPPDALVLMEVDHGLRYTPPARGGASQRRRFLEGALREVRTRETLLGWFQSRVPPEPGPTSEP